MTGADNRQHRRREERATGGGASQSAALLVEGRGQKATIMGFLLVEKDERFWHDEEEAESRMRVLSQLRVAL